MPGYTDYDRAESWESEDDNQENAALVDALRRDHARMLTNLLPAVQEWIAMNNVSFPGDSPENDTPVIDTSRDVEIYSDNSFVAYDLLGRCLLYTYFYEETWATRDEPGYVDEHVEWEVIA